MTNTIRVEHRDGTTDTLPFSSTRFIRQFGKQDKLELWTDRDEANAAGLQKQDDEVYWDTSGSAHRGGILRDIRRGGDGKARLIIDGFEQYGIDAARSPANDIRTGTDKELVEQAINDVTALSIGSTEQTASGLTITAHNASPARVIRQVRNAAGGEIQYNVDKSVDYVDSLGADKTGTLLAPRRRNVTDFTINEKGGGRGGNHVKCLGAGSGDAQLDTTATASQFSGSDRTIWATYEDVEIVEQSTLDNVCQIVADEMYGGRTEVELLANGVTPELGDQYHVEKPEDDLDADLYVVKVVEIEDVQGRRYKLTLSDQRFLDGDLERDIRENVERYVRAETRSGLGEYDDIGNAPALQDQGGYLVWVTGDGPTTPGGVHVFRPGEGYNRVADVDDLRPRLYEYGDLSDGDTVFSSNATVSGVKFYNTFEVQSGVTLSVASGENLIVYAQDAVINGTIDGSGADGGGGAGGDAALENDPDTSHETPGGDGANGIDGTYAPSAAGGAGGAGGNAGQPVSGGEGGDGGSAPNSEEARLWPHTGTPTPELMPALDLHTRAGAAGAGGGGEANTTSTRASGGDGSVPGAGGGGAIRNGEVTGGDGGEGGALIVIMAESFSGTGTIDASGGGGTFGTNTEGNPENNYGGGGGGGSGGAIIVISDDISDWASQTHDVSEGNGVNPADDANGISGGSGQEGEVGFVYGFDRDTRTVFS